MELEQLYRERLEGVHEDAIQKGALDRAVAVESAMENVGLEEPVQIDSKWPTLLKYQEIYLESREDRRNASEPSVKALKREFRTRLEALIVELTRAGKVDEVDEAREFLREISEETDESESPEAGPVFDFEQEIFYGAKMGSSEAELIDALESNGIKVFKSSPMSGGKKNISANGLNFRVNENGEFFQIYILGEDAPLPGSLKLRQSTVSEFEQVIGEKAREADGSRDRDTYGMETRYFSIDLITMAKGDDTVFSVMLTRK